MEERKKTAPGLVQIETEDLGGGVFRLSGILVGNIIAVENDGEARDAAREANETLPDRALIPVLAWSLAREIRHNPYSVLELKLSVLLLVWGFWLLLPFDTFSVNPALYAPLRNFFGTAPGNFWYANAENIVGVWFAVLGLSGIVAIFLRRRGDDLRRISISFQITNWSILWLLQAQYNFRSQATINLLVIIVFMAVALRHVFRKAITP